MAMDGLRLELTLNSETGVDWRDVFSELFLILRSLDWLIDTEAVSGFFYVLLFILIGVLLDLIGLFELGRRSVSGFDLCNAS